MDNVCHTLVGAALAEAGLKRRTRYASATLMIAANLPDIDVLSFISGTPPVAFRRGWTHGIGAQLLLPVLFTGVLWLVGQRSTRESADPRPLHAGWLLALSYVGVYSHVFLDYLNNYGVRLLTPLDWRWFYGDTLFIVDPWLWVVLGTGVWLARRRGMPALSRGALLVAACYIAALLMSARTARTVVAEQWSAAHGAAPLALMVGPVPISPFTREVIIDAGTHYERGTFSWPSSVTFNRAQIPKNDNRPEVASARSARNVRALLVWSRFPFWTLEPVEGGTRVTLGDARFMDRVGMFSASTVVATEVTESTTIQ